MRKPIILVALAGCSLAADAADVTLYGKIYAELANETAGSGAAQVDSFTVDDAQNLGRLGIRFSQELRDGLTAFGKFEFSVNAPDSTNDFAMRDAHVGLRGRFGSIAAGRFDGIYKTTGGVAWDPFTFSSLQLAGFGGQSSTNFGNAGFIDRAIEYRFPEFKEGGTRFSGALQYGADTSGVSTTTPNESFLGGVTFGFGSIDLIYAMSNNGLTGAGNQKFGVRVAGERVAVMVQAEDVEQGGFDPSGDGRFLAGIVTFETGNFMWVATLADYDTDFSSIDDAGTPLDPLDDFDVFYTSATWTLGFRYYWAKNIWTTAGYRRTDSDADAYDSTATVLGLRFDF
jgi:predicted porin